MIAELGAGDACLPLPARVVRTAVYRQRQAFAARIECQAVFGRGAFQAQRHLLEAVIGDLQPLQLQRRIDAAGAVRIKRDAGIERGKLHT